MAKRNIPTVAMIYDFDGTLAPGNMQEFGFIQAVQKNKNEFWEKSNQMAEENDADSILCYMYSMIKDATYYGVGRSKESFEGFGKNVKFFAGVEQWFHLINQYGKAKGLEVKHYIISSGLKEMIEGTSIAKEFEYIYASSFLYDNNGVAVWPGVAVNYTTKTQFLFKINKGIKEISDNNKINDFVPEGQRPVPFERMIYFGDGQTDIPCMKMVKVHGGHSVALYDKPQKKNTALKLIKDDRVNFVCHSDYTEGKELYKVVTTILDKIKADFDFNLLLEKHQNKQ
ncbi:MAG: HAD family hydrolase [Bacteroidota bacterium]|nr:HAD family hydrolase [Bacteroidota bacterium]